MKFNRLIFLLSLILVLAVTLRFWNFPLRYGIGYDGSRDALVSFEAKSQLQLPLTGSFSSVGPITFGPWYYWYITAANFIIPNPWAPWISIALASLGMVLLMYFIGRQLQNKKLGLILAYLTSFSPAQLVAAVNLQQHALIGFLTALSIWLFLKLLKKNSLNLAIVFGFCLGVAANVHFQAGGLVILGFLLLVIKRNFKHFSGMLAGLFLSSIPMLIFELNNHWFNTRNVLDYLLIGQYRIWTSNRWLTFTFAYFPEFWSYVTGLPKLPSMFLMLSTPPVLIYLFFRKKLHHAFIPLSIHFMILVVLLRYWRGEKFFGYLQFFHPFIFLFSGTVLYAVLQKIPKAYALILIIPAMTLAVRTTVLNMEKISPLHGETRKRMIALELWGPGNRYKPLECSLVYDRDRIQGLLLFLYMQNRFADDGIPVMIYNPGCPQVKGEKIGSDLIILKDTDKASSFGLKPISSKAVYKDVARWWFKEQP